MRRKLTIPALGALLVLGLMVVAQSATATHVRPKAATPFYASTVPSYKRVRNAEPRARGTACVLVL